MKILNIWRADSEICETMAKVKMSTHTCKKSINTMNKQILNNSTMIPKY